MEEEGLPNTGLPHALPRETLVLICSHLSDACVFRTLPAVCAELRLAINHECFLRLRVALTPRPERQARQLGPQAAPFLPGCMLIDSCNNPTPEDVSEGRGAALVDYLDEAHLDIAQGLERYPLTLNSRLSHAGSYYDTSPPTIAHFRYAAGPLRAPCRLQVFRSGAPEGKGYGVRALQDVRAGQLVCLFWGRYERALQSGRHQLNVYPRPSDRPRGNSALRSPSRRETTQSSQPFRINATHEGNLARWINHSPVAANLQPRILWSKDVARSAELVSLADWSSLFEWATPQGLLPGVDLPFVALFASRELRAGEELLWDAGPEPKPAPAFYCGAWRWYGSESTAVTQARGEVLRGVMDGRLRLARWTTTLGCGDVEMRRRDVQERLVVQDISGKAGGVASASDEAPPATLLPGSDWPRLSMGCAGSEEEHALAMERWVARHVLYEHGLTMSSEATPSLPGNRRPALQGLPSPPSRIWRHSMGGGAGAGPRAGGGDDPKRRIEM